MIPFSFPQMFLPPLPPIVTFRYDLELDSIQILFAKVSFPPFNPCFKKVETVSLIYAETPFRYTGVYFSILICVIIHFKLKFKKIFF